MKTYLFSIFVRGFLAFSGFLVFIVTAKLFGADGRGVIGYGTSLFASLGIILSFNLGRVFLEFVLAKEQEVTHILPRFLILNILVSLLTILVGLSYWEFSSSARQVLSFSQALGFSLTSFFFVWSHNGHLFFSSTMNTPRQDRTIFGIRTAITIFLIFFWLLRVKDLTSFIWGYSTLLFLGSLVEMFVLMKINNAPFLISFDIIYWKKIFSSSWWPHADYVSFNVFPLILMVLSAPYLSTADMGRANFANQIVNLIFLLSTTANMRVTAYVASVGFQKSLQKFKKLFLFTAGASMAAIAVIYFSLIYIIELPSFSSFEGVNRLFLIASLSVPGFALFQFFNPIWIETKKLRIAAILDITNLIFCLLLIPFMVNKWGVIGLMSLFSIFHINIFIVHCLLFLVLSKFNTKESI